MSDSLRLKMQQAVADYITSGTYHQKKANGYGHNDRKEVEPNGGYLTRHDIEDQIRKSVARYLPEMLEQQAIAAKEEEETVAEFKRWTNPKDRITPDGLVDKIEALIETHGYHVVETDIISPSQTGELMKWNLSVGFFLLEEI